MLKTFKLTTLNVSFGQVPPPRDLLFATDTPPAELLDGLRLIGAGVVILQEVMERHLPDIASTLGLGDSWFVPMHHLLERAGGRNRLGVAVLSRFPISDQRPLYYAGFNDDFPELWSGGQDLDMDGRRLSSVLQTFIVDLGDGVRLRMGNTHFPWSPRGRYTATQAGALERLQSAALQSGVELWGGDLNMPRGENAGWDLLGQCYQSHIPAGWRTTLDPVHDAAAADWGLERVVDNLLTIPGSQRVRLHDLALHQGMSDHQAISAMVNVTS